MDSEMGRELHRIMREMKTSSFDHLDKEWEDLTPGERAHLVGLAHYFFNSALEKWVPF